MTLIGLFWINLVMWRQFLRLQRILDEEGRDTSIRLNVNLLLVEIVTMGSANSALHDLIGLR